MSTTIGIMGGMGPLATIDLMKKIISHTPAIKDQDHLHVIADNYPQIPDRNRKAPEQTSLYVCGLIMY